MGLVGLVRGESMKADKLRDSDTAVFEDGVWVEENPEDSKLGGDGTSRVV